MSFTYPKWDRNIGLVISQMRLSLTIILLNIIKYNPKGYHIMPNATLSITTPVMTVELFASVSGLNKSMVEKMVHDGRLPILPKTGGKQKTLINIALITANAMNAKY